MTSPTDRNRIPTIKLSPILIISFLCSGQAIGQDGTGHAELWRLVDSMGGNMPPTKQNLEKVLDTNFLLEERDKYKSVWISGPILLTSDIGISSVSLMLDPDERFDDQSGITLSLVGDCVRLNEIKDKYGSLKIVDSPRGHSLAESTVYRSSQPWGSYNFSFKIIARDCLSSVSLLGVAR